MGEAGGGYCYPDSPEDICTPGWPDRRLARTMQAMRGNGWSIEGLARVFRLTPGGVELYLKRNDVAEVGEVGEHG